MVEDDKGGARALELLLANWGFEVRVAPTLSMAREMLAAEGTRPTHVILDLMLPDGSGDEVLATIRREGWPIWVAITTGVDDPDRLNRLRAMGAEVVLAKPINLTRLIAALTAT